MWKRSARGLLLLLAAAAAHAAPPQVTVSVDGVEGPLLKNVLAYLSINTYANAPTLSDSLVQRLNGRAPDEIRQSLQPFGYYDVKVDSRLTPVSGGWSAHYTITLPPPVRIRHIEVVLSGAGREDPDFGKYLTDFPIRPGDQLDQQLYEGSKNRLLELAAQRGYIDARYTETELQVNPEQHWADVSLGLDTGPRYYFGDVSFVQDFMEESFLRRYIRFKPGDPYDNDQLLTLQYALNDSGYFTSVNIEALRDQAVDGRIPVRITLTPRKRNKYTVGLGYGTDTGPRVTLGWNNSRINGLGHTLAAQAQFSHVMETFLLSYTVPQSDPASERLVYSAGNSREILGGFVTYSSTVGISRYVALGPWTVNQYLLLEHDRSDLEGVNTNSTILVPGVAFSRTYSDDLILPTHGYRVSLDVRGANNAFFSDTSFLQGHLQAKLLVPLTDSTRLLLRGELGATGVKSFAELPVTQRFFAGGDQSVRGFVYNSLGPRDAQGNVIGGKDLMVGSFELDQMFGPVFGAAVFIDTGNVVNTFANSLEKGVGAGLRWRTPVGMVRFDLAHPVKRPDLDRVRVHISIGPDL